MACVNQVRDSKVNPLAASFYHRIVTDLPLDLVKHVLEKIHIGSKS